MLTFLVGGVISVIERVLLAATQFRFGPRAFVVLGFSLAVLDGLKIYGKGTLNALAIGFSCLLIGAAIQLLVGCMASLLWGGYGHRTGSEYFGLLAFAMVALALPLSLGLGTSVAGK